jgi:mannose-1-phosphate guanylyltransferase
MREGALWNSFIFVAGAGTLIGLMRRGYPSVVAAFETAVATGAPAVRALYERLVNIDCSRDFLQGGEANVSVLRVPECGWRDLGTPPRVLRCLRRLPQEIKRTCHSTSVSLAVALAASAA